MNVLGGSERAECVETYAAYAQKAETLLLEMKSRLTVKYNIELSDGKLNAKELDSLAQMLARCPETVRDELINDPADPERLFVLSVVAGDIAVPYLTLREASERVEAASYVAPRNWGFIEGNKLVLPPTSSDEDSTVWTFLGKFCEKHFADSHTVTRLESTNETIPVLDNFADAKSETFKTLCVRIMELAKNPLSATLRRDTLDGKNLLRNAIDFVVLEEIYRRDKRYANLTLSGLAITSGRQSRQVVAFSRSGKQTNQTVYSGYALLNYLHEAQPDEAIKGYEKKAFPAFILTLLRNLIPETIPENWELPKVLFESPSIQIRSEIRKGPVVKTKRGMRQNLYIPFGFVKARDCHLMPEISRRQFTALGSSLMTKLDAVSQLPIKEASECLPLYREIMACAYIASDTCRKEWQRNAFVCPETQLTAMFGFDFDPENIRINLPEVKRKLRNLHFAPVHDDPSRQEALLLEVAKELKSRNRT